MKQEKLEEYIKNGKQGQLKECFLKDYKYEYQKLGKEVKMSEKKFHKDLQKLCNYKKLKKILNLKYGPIVTEEQLNL